MADSNFRGPLTSMGALEVNAATTAVEPIDGPSMYYQGWASPDLRFAPFNKDGFRPGQQPAYLTGGDFMVVNTILQARSSTILAANQTATAAIAITLVTAQAAGITSAANIAVGVPIVPVGTTVATVAAFALDFGFTTGTTAANSSAVVVVDSSVFRQGQWIVIAGAANAAASRSLVTQVQSTVNATTIQISPVAVTTLLNVPIGQGNLWGSGLLPLATQFGPSAPTATGHAFCGAMEAGLARIYNPREMSSRNITIVASAAPANAYSALVSGWDVYGNPMTEVISQAAAVTSNMGKKAFKYISSITSGTTANGQVSFGIGDVVGLPLRAEYWEQVSVQWNGSQMVNSNGFLAGQSPVAPANSTTDPRGSLQISTSITTGGQATAISGVASNGTGRLTVTMNLEPMVSVLATPINLTPMFGPANYTAST